MHVRTQITSDLDQSMRYMETIPPSIIDCLAGSSLGIGLDHTDLEHVAGHLLIRRVQPGDLLIKEGDVGRSTVLVVHGRVAIYSEAFEAEVAEFGRGCVLGEIGAMLGVTRTMTVRSKSEATIGVLEHGHLEELLVKYEGLGQALCQLARQRLKADVDREAQALKSCLSKRASVNKMIVEQFPELRDEELGKYNFVRRGKNSPLFISNGLKELTILVLKGRVMVSEILHKGDTVACKKYRKGQRFTVETAGVLVKTCDEISSIAYLADETRTDLEGQVPRIKLQDTYAEPPTNPAMAGIARRTSLAIWCDVGLMRPITTKPLSRQSSLRVDVVKLADSASMIEFLEALGIPASFPAQRICQDLDVVSFEPIHQYMDDEPLKLVTKRFGRDIMSLSLADCWAITDEGLLAVFENCPQLEELNLSSCWAISERGFLQAFKASRTLKRLEVRSCHGFTDACLGALPKGLQHLDISLCKNLSSEAWKGICGHAETLQSLSMQRCVRISSESILSHPPVLFPAMHSLDLSDCALLSDEALLRMISMMPNLKSLNISFCQGLSHEIINSLGQQHTQITDLTMNNCERILDDASVGTLVEWPQLRRLSVKACKDLTTSSLVSIGRLKKLEYLNVASCPRIDERALAREALSHGWTLAIESNLASHFSM